MVVADHRQPRRAVAWALMAASFGFLATAQPAWAWLHVGGRETFPSLSDAPHLVAATLLVAALVMLGRDGSPVEDLLDSLETAIVGIAVGLGVWLAVGEPYLANRELAFGDLAWSVVVPMLDALALAIALRTAAQNRFRMPATVLLALGTGLLLASDVARSIVAMGGTLESGRVIAAMSVAPPLVIAAAALDPAMTDRRIVAEAPAVLALGRVLWLSVAALTPAVLLTLIATGLGTRATRTIAAVCAVVVVVLALARMWRLVATVRTLTERNGQDRLAAMVEHSSDVVLLVDADGLINYASPGLASTLGHRPTDWTGRSVIDLVAGDDREPAATERSTTS